MDDKRDDRTQVNRVCEGLSDFFDSAAQFVFEVAHFPALLTFFVLLILGKMDVHSWVDIVGVGVLCMFVDAVLQPLWQLLACLVALPLLLLSWVFVLGFSEKKTSGPVWLYPRTRPGRQHIPRRVRERVYRKAGGRCVYCGSTKELQIDHIIPVSRGGSSDEANLQLLCGPCNRRKGARFP